MKVLLIGDIVGSPGRDVVKQLVPKITKEQKIELVIANGENAAGGSGITPAVAKEILKSGVDVLTSGDHIWKKKEAIDILDTEPRVLRPLNYPAGTPGNGSYIARTACGINVGVINVVGRVFMTPVECPFKTIMEEVKKISETTPVILVDIHAEATSEKIAMGWYLDGLVSCVFGTHTHIQTADERILPKGTAYITDLGMAGPYDSVLGRKTEQVLERFLTQMPTRFEMAAENVQMHGAIVDIDPKTGKALSIKRI